jgi:DNA-directed RNA polymerase specialized sigma subunit
MMPVQAGCEGLMHGIDLYDPFDSKGAKLGSYATIWIKSRMQNLIRAEKAVIHVPYDAEKRYKELAQLHFRLREKLNRCGAYTSLICVSGSQIGSVTPV